MFCYKHEITILLILRSR